MRHTFILLNYLNYQDTVNCVKTILNLKDASISIVIIDNNSRNSSIEKIREHFPIDKNIHYIQSEINLGFAKGNNLGFNYCKYNIESDFITILNNDTLINDVNFCNKIEEISYREDFDILGPKIITKDGFNQNPQRLQGYTLKELRMKTIKMFVMKVILNLIYYTNTYKLIKKIKGPRTLTRKSYHQDSDEIKNVQLHGACLILSKKFISKSKYVFYPETFLYMEEDILYYLGLMENLYFLYSPNLEINHLEDQSTNMLINNDIRKYLFVYKEGLKSAKILIKIMKRGIEN